MKPIWSYDLQFVAQQKILYKLVTNNSIKNITLLTNKKYPTKLIWHINYFFLASFFLSNKIQNISIRRLKQMVI